MSVFLNSSIFNRVTRYQNRRHCPTMGAVQHANPIYLDYNATTPVRQEAIDKMSPFLYHYGNPSSSHVLGDLPKQALREARHEVAQAVGASTEEDSIYFCSCGTEADNWAIWSAISGYRMRYPDRLPHVVSSVIEHPAVLVFLEQLQTLKLLEYDLVPVDSEGFLDLNALESFIREETCLVTIMHSNNEIGTIQRFSDICKIVRNFHHVLLHSDMAQSVGRAPINLSDMGIDMCTIVAHKFGGPKGVAALYCRPGTELHPFLNGGGQEHGMRSGTENVLLAVGMGEAIRCACKDVENSIQDMRSKRDLLFDLLHEQLLDRLNAQGLLKVHGPQDDMYRLPNTLSFGVKGIDSRAVIQSLREKVAMSSGSACHSGSASGGGVLNAVGCPLQYQMGTFRLSVGHYSTREEIETAAGLIVNAIETELNKKQNVVM